MAKPDKRTLQRILSLLRQTYGWLTNTSGDSPASGPKTAHCTLLFSFGMAMFPVDTHIHRIAIRLGLVPAKATAEQTGELLKPLIPREGRYEMHVLLIEHGRKTCRAIGPRCDVCPLLRMCPKG